MKHNEFKGVTAVTTRSTNAQVLTFEGNDDEEDFILILDKAPIVKSTCITPFASVMNIKRTGNEVIALIRNLLKDKIRDFM